MVWKKGQSGNPGGHPRALREVTAFAREKSQAALERLADIVATSKNEAAVVRAAEVLLERGFGKPLQSIHNTFGRSKHSRDLTRDQLLAIVSSGHKEGTQDLADPEPTGQDGEQIVTQ